MVAGGNQHLYAATIRIELMPGYDRAAFDAIWELPPHPHVRPIWLLRTYHSFDADLNMMVLADRESAITGYVMSWLRPVPGIVDTSISDVLDWHMLATPEQMIEVAEQFFQLNHERD